MAQKGVDNKVMILDKLSKLFGVGKVRKHYYDDNWYYRISGINDLQVIINYLDKNNFTFLTKKLDSYLLWKVI